MEEEEEEEEKRPLYSFLRLLLLMFRTVGAVQEMLVLWVLSVLFRTAGAAQSGRCCRRSVMRKDVGAADAVAAGQCCWCCWSAMRVLRPAVGAVWCSSET